MAARGAQPDKVTEPVEPVKLDDAAESTEVVEAVQGYIVCGAAVVLRTADGAERYLYRGAPVVGGVFSDESIQHAISVGLIEETK